MSNSKQRHAIALAALLALAPSPIYAVQPVPEVARPDVDAEFDLDQEWALSGAVFPGFAIHGFGHWLLGEEETGYKLLLAELTGAAGIVGGIAGLAVSGAADQFVVPLTWTTIGGAGIFFSSFFADVYGVASARGALGSPFLLEPDLDLLAGYQHVHNPALPEATHFMDLGVVWRFSDFALDGRFRNAVDGDNYRIEIGLSWRLIGATAHHEDDDGHALDLRAGYLHHSWGDFGVEDNFVEIEIRSRVDLRWLGPTLEGSFFDAHAGIATGSYDYDLPDIGTDSSTLLLGGFGWGFYLTDDPDGWGEVEIFYDHRHDGYVSGLKVEGLGSGPAGHFGLRADYGIWRGLGVAASFAMGSSYATNVGILYRYGGSR